jgi:hypothetical protein
LAEHAHPLFARFMPDLNGELGPELLGVLTQAGAISSPGLSRPKRHVQSGNVVGGLQAADRPSGFHLRARLRRTAVYFTL